MVALEVLTSAFARAIVTVHVHKPRNRATSARHKATAVFAGDGFHIAHSLGYHIGVFQFRLSLFRFHGVTFLLQIVPLLSLAALPLVSDCGPRSAGSADLGH